MPDHLRHPRYTSRRSQHGQALLLLLVLLGLAAGMFVISRADNMSAAARADTDARVLAQAKQALIGYAAMDNNRPGALPCPDTNNDGSANLYSGIECPGYVASSDVYIGRLPWRTIGLPDLRDSNGERLWYAVSRDFARNPSCLPNCPDLTSDTLGRLTVTGIAPVSNAVAIVFAPGLVINDPEVNLNQVRAPTDLNNIANYLESTNAVGGTTTFVAGPVIDPVTRKVTINDRLLAITNMDFMPLVETRVAREMIAILGKYYAATATSPTYGNGGGSAGVYPWAATRDNGNSIAGYNRSHFPCGTALPVDWNTTVPSSTSVPPATTPDLPRWLKNGCSLKTGWTFVIYYAVAKNKLVSPPRCDTCRTGQLKLDTNVNVDLVLITPGGYPGPPPRGAWPTGSIITGYFEDSENSDNTDDKFVTPSPALYPNALNHDRIYALP